jgi:hypothetical protein
MKKNKIQRALVIGVYKLVPIVEPVQNVWHLVQEERPICMYRVTSEHCGALIGYPILDVCQYFFLDARYVVRRLQASLGQA